MRFKKVNLQTELANIDKYWLLKEVGQINNHAIEIAKLKGEYEMHMHDTGEKIFYIISGQLKVEFSDSITITVDPGEFIIISNYTYHKPIAPEETHVMMLQVKNN